MRPVCVKCEVEMRAECNNTKVVELFQQNAAIYRIWNADIYKCPICEVEVVTGFAKEPVMEHFDKDLGAEVLKIREHGGYRIVYSKEL